MNEHLNEFNIGDLILVGDELALIVEKTERLPLVPTMYRVRFCMNDYLDKRWIFSDDFTFYRGQQ